MASWSAQQPAPPGTQPTQTFQYHTRPAYTPVQVRTGFGYGHLGSGSMAATATTMPPASTPAAAAEPEPQKKRINWPDSVRFYVQRSFQTGNLDPSVSRADMEAKLKEIISQANDTGDLYTIDWNLMPLPQHIILRQRARSLVAGVDVSPPAAPPVEPTAPSTSAPAPTADPPHPKKRKSSDMADDGSSATPTPPWRAAAAAAGGSRASLEERITYPSPDKRQTAEENPPPPQPKTSKLQKQLEKRQRRSDGGYRSAYRSPSPSPSRTSGPVVGTCQTLEKRYLRLTAPPKPGQVRPEYVLRQTLDLLKTKWKNEGNYAYICDQFKSVRQDLTVQRIKNEFTVNVYEIHARIALEKGDLGEYNQCQTQLMALYKLGLKGYPIEFKAYRILYFIHTANRAALNDAIANLTPAEKEEHAIKHALEVRSSLALGNYHRFFQLYLDTPHMGAYLMDVFVDRERLAALCNICRAYRPDVRLRFITEELGFESDSEAVDFIIQRNGQHLLEERDGTLFVLTGKAGSHFESAKTEAFRKVDIKGQI